MRIVRCNIGFAIQREMADLNVAKGFLRAVEKVPDMRRSNSNRACLRYVDEV